MAQDGITCITSHGYETNCSIIKPSSSSARNPDGNCSFSFAGADRGRRFGLIRFRMHVKSDLQVQ